MNFFIQTERYVHPEDRKDMQYWAFKWGVTTRQLSEAIIDTGSTNTKVLKEQLRKNRLLQFPLICWLRSFSGRTSAARFQG